RASRRPMVWTQRRASYSWTPTASSVVLTPAGACRRPGRSRTNWYVGCPGDIEPRCLHRSYVNPDIRLGPVNRYDPPRFAEKISAEIPEGLLAEGARRYDRMVLEAIRTENREGQGWSTRSSRTPVAVPSAAVSCVRARRSTPPCSTRTPCS